MRSTTRKPSQTWHACCGVLRSTEHAQSRGWRFLKPSWTLPSDGPLEVGRTLEQILRTDKRHEVKNGQQVSNWSSDILPSSAWVIDSSDKHRWVDAIFSRLVVQILQGLHWLTVHYLQKCPRLCVEQAPLNPHESLNWNNPLALSGWCISPLMYQLCAFLWQALDVKIEPPFSVRRCNYSTEYGVEGYFLINYSNNLRWLPSFESGIRNARTCCHQILWMKRLPTTLTPPLDNLIPIRLHQSLIFR